MDYPSTTRQGNQASLTQCSNSGELSSVVLNLDDVLSISENPQQMEICKIPLSAYPQAKLCLPDEEEAEHPAPGSAGNSKLSGY